jgi:DNA repair photolyase
MTAEKILIKNKQGLHVEAIAPVIISASRSTDIPAFYAKWFFNRMAKGYCAWYNPFNINQKMYISFARCRVIVFWTKDPSPIIPYLPELDKRGIHYYFQVTLNDYEKEGFEPNVPSVAKRIETFKQLSSLIGKERVIWRFDPLIIIPQHNPRMLLTKIWHIGNELKRHTDKLVFSFVDVKAYRKVQNNLVKETSFFNKENVEQAEMTDAQRTEIVEGLVKLRGIWKQDGWDLQLATCAEDIALEKYGIEHNRCIDGELMKRIFAEDEELVYYLHTGKLPERDMFGEIPPIPDKPKNLKDKGQRKICGCMISKDIGMYNTCRHFCVYCYANTSKETVLNNKDKHNDESESIII